jgi:hypothetical protein
MVGEVKAKINEFEFESFLIHKASYFGKAATIVRLS